MGANPCQRVKRRKPLPIEIGRAFQSGVTPASPLTTVLSSCRTHTYPGEHATKVAKRDFDEADLVVAHVIQATRVLSARGQEPDRLRRL